MYALGWLIRRDAAALVALWLAVSLVGIGSRPALDYAEALAGTAVLVVLLHRAGVLALTVAFFYYYVLFRLPLTFEMSNWFAVRSTVGLLLLVAIGAYGFWVSLAGKPLFGTFLAEEEAAA